MPRHSHKSNDSKSSRRGRLSSLGGLLAIGCALLLTAGSAHAQDSIGQGKISTPRKHKPTPRASKKPQAKPLQDVIDPWAKQKPTASKKPATTPAPTDPFFRKPPKAEVDLRRGANPFPAQAASDTTATDEATQAPAPHSALEFFRQELSPHGQFLDHPEHGTVWIPDAKQVATDFAPYRSNGHWAVDKNGQWTWMSGYPWGNIPFHFGRWTWLSDVAGGAPAWAWVPDTEYAPAWVVWRTAQPDPKAKPAQSPAKRFVGWAPMPPTHRWVDGKRELHPGTRALPFWFVSSQHLFDSRLSNFVIGDPDAAKKLHAATKILPAHDALLGQLAAKMRELAPASEGGPSDELDEALAEVDPSRALRAASPTFEQAQVPQAAQPKERIEPIDGESLLPSFAEAPPAAPEQAVPEAKPVHPELIERAPRRLHDRSGRRRLRMDRREIRRRFVRRCVQTSRGKRCWTYRYPPRWRGR